MMVSMQNVNWRRIGGYALIFIGGGFAALWLEPELVEPSWWQPVGALIAMGAAYLLNRLGANRS